MAEIFLKLHLETLEEGGYVATSHDLPGLVAQGRTMTETVEIAHDVARKLIESYEEHGDPLPSVRFLNFSSPSCNLYQRSDFIH
jgi:predicted RNase H-like HicB family nuclease